MLNPLFIRFHAMKLFMLVMGTSITSSNFSARLSYNSEPMSEKVSKMLMAMST
ncbi:hypothetical protein Lalb_Chr11g0070711 [Lupinus albus]|uniref:Uncharacterized protein n=1 Tax=Lupinus albus TaxID=3870 RepID=A0A6A4PSA0_LUPAL|nr:hypothetical protein Lalb_Chr11g0070711 [Lupinus albus]